MGIDLPFPFGEKSQVGFLMYILLSIHGRAGAGDCLSTHGDRLAVVIYTLSSIPRTGRDNTFDRTGQVTVQVETRKERKTNLTNTETDPLTFFIQTSGLRLSPPPHGLALRLTISLDLMTKISGLTNRSLTLLFAPTKFKTFSIILYTARTEKFLNKVSEKQYLLIFRMKT